MATTATSSVASTRKDASTGASVVPTAMEEVDDEGEWEGLKISEDTINKSKKRVKHFYKHQNELVDAFIDIARQRRRKGDEEDEARRVLTAVDDDDESDDDGDDGDGDDDDDDDGGDAAADGDGDGDGDDGGDDGGGDGEGGDVEEGGKAKTNKKKKKKKRKGKGKALKDMDDAELEKAMMEGQGLFARIRRNNVKVAVWASLIANIVLFIAKIWVAFLSGSLAILASALDSFLDLLSGAILFATTWYIAQPNRDRFPIGKSRMEPVGILIFASFMLSLSFQIILQSIQAIITPAELTLSLIDVAIILSTIVIKTLLWLYCRAVTGSPTTAALATDHLNDVLSNALGGAAAVGSVYLNPLIDPMGAMVMAVYIMYVWGCTLWDHVQMLSGKSADPQTLQLITFISCHHPGVLQVDTVRGWHLGFKVLIEVDIVVDKFAPMHTAHDIGESLQKRLEELECCERAFVHLDFETEHSAADEHKFV